jgi:glutamate racemase
MKKIGVFDSGIGGLSVANAIKKSFPDLIVQFVNDAENVPYGNKSPEMLLKLVAPILAQLERDGCELIVVACNTVSTTILDELKKILHVPLIGIEPMVDTATSLTQRGVIAVCATPTTLKSHRYADLKNEFANEVTVLEPDCSDWSFMIENDLVDRARIAERIDEVCAKGADVVVLACTHYHWIEDLINGVVAGRARVIQPEALTIETLKTYING